MTNQTADQEKQADLQRALEVAKNASLILRNAMKRLEQKRRR